MDWLEVLSLKLLSSLAFSSVEDIYTSSSHAESGCSLEQQRVCGTESTIGASTPGQQNIENVETASGSVTANQTEKDISSTNDYLFVIESSRIVCRSYYVIFGCKKFPNNQCFVDFDNP
jgi:hypothetical protein